MANHSKIPSKWDCIRAHMVWKNLGNASRRIERGVPLLGTGTGNMLRCYARGLSGHSETCPECSLLEEGARKVLELALEAQAMTA